MRSVGFNVGKGTLRFVVLEGTLQAPVFMEHDRFDEKAGTAVPERMAWLAESFDKVLRRVQPDRAAYRLHHSKMLTQEQVGIFHYPWGLLALRCGQLKVEVSEIASISMTAKRFGLPKGAKPMEECDALIGAHPPGWDDVTRYAACAAWAALD